MNELDALRIVSEHNGESINAMLEAAKQAGFPDMMDNRLRFQSLYEQDFIEGAFVLGLPVTVTQLGKDRLEQLQKQAEQFAEEKRNRNRDKKIAVATMLIPFVIFILEVIKDNFQLLISFFSNLFG